MRKSFYFIFVLFFFNLGLSCSQPSQKKVRFTGGAQGTYYAITYFDAEGRNFQPEVIEFLKRFDQVASLWEKNSLIFRVNNNQEVEVDGIFEDIFQKSMKVSEETGGKFDITVGPLTAAWGFGFSNKEKLNQRQIDSILHFVNYKLIHIQNGRVVKQNPNIHIDFNAIAKGYSVDMLGKFFESKNIENFLIDIGGEVLAKGTKPGNLEWIVGIEKPTQDQYAEREVKSKVRLKNAALATSGNYRKYYEENGVRYAHTIDPETGYPVQHSLLSVSVLANECWRADAYATAFMVMGMEEALKFISHHPELEAYFIYYEENQMKTLATKGFKNFIVED